VSDEREYDSFPFLLAKKLTHRLLSPPGQTVLINYSLSREIPIYSFYDIYLQVSQKKDLKGLFKDKVVIIGTLFTFEDRHSTPLDYRHYGDHKERTPGMLIHATTLNSLLSGSFFSEPGTLEGALSIFVVSLIAVLLCYNRRPFPAAVLCLAEAALLCLLTIYMFNIHYVIRVMPLLSAVLLAYGATTVFHYYSEERKRIKIRERFASYVPEKIIEQIVDADIEALTEGEQREVALLFSDIREFTTYSEKHKSDPKRIVGFLNQYHKEMTEIILSNNGTVAQLIGDGIFAFFGAPVELSDPIFSALKSAVQMKDKIIELRPKWRDYGMEDLRIGIGIHAGDTIVGNIGSVKKMAYVAIGDNTNIASRIEGLTKEFHETILISEAAYEPIRDRIYARPLGQVEIKGHSGIDIFAVDGMKG
jgi:adenylate cyclase